MRFFPIPYIVIGIAGALLLKDSNAWLQAISAALYALIGSVTMNWLYKRGVFKSFK